MWAITLAQAQAPIPQLPLTPDMLGPYPILQLFAGIFTLMGLALGLLLWWRGQQSGHPSKQRAHDKGLGAQTYVYANGPLQEALNILAKINASLERLAAISVDFNSLRADYSLFQSDQRAGLQETRHVLRGEIQRSYSDLDGRMDKVVETLREEQRRAYKELEDRLRAVEIRQGPRR